MRSASTTMASMEARLMPRMSTAMQISGVAPSPLADSGRSPPAPLRASGFIVALPRRGRLVALVPGGTGELPVEGDQLGDARHHPAIDGCRRVLAVGIHGAGLGAHQQFQGLVDGGNGVEIGRASCRERAETPAVGGASQYKRTTEQT